MCAVRENKTESYFTKLTQLNYFYVKDWCMWGSRIEYQKDFFLFTVSHHP